MVGIRRQYTGSAWSSLLITEFPLLGFPAMPNSSTKFQGIRSLISIFSLKFAEILRLKKPFPTPSWVVFFQTREQPRTLYRFLGTLSKGFASQEIRTKEIRLSDVISNLDQTEPLYCLRLPPIFAGLSHGLYLARARG